MASVYRSTPAPSRSKSCAACNKAKRRCDFALPACLRCSDRGIECQYPQRTRSNIMRMGSSTVTDGLAPVSIQSPMQPTSPGSYFASATLDDILADPCMLDSSYLKDVVGSIARSESLWGDSPAESTSAVGSGARSPPRDGSVNIENDDQDISKAPFMQLPSTLSRGFESLPEAVAGRVQLATTYLGTIHKVLVETLGTPWCHKEVFKNQTPECIRDSIASSALYMAKTDENKPFVMRAILSKLNDLAKSPIPSTHRETLARTHSFGIYLLISLFDGDIGSRAAAEAVLPQLQLTCESLRLHLCDANLTAAPSARALPLFPLAETDSFWRSWILHESTRRTWLFTNQLQLMYSFLTGKRSNVQCIPQHQAWSLSGHLWSATNAVDFAVAWGSKRHLIATMGRLDEVFEVARPEELDEFGRMLLMCFLGEHQARGWLAMKGEVG